MTTIKTATPTERLSAYLSFFEDRNGTIESISIALKIDADQLLNGEPSEMYLASNYAKGWSAVMTCTQQHNSEVVFPDRTGDLDFWLGAAEGYRCKQLLGQAALVHVDVDGEDSPRL